MTIGNILSRAGKEQRAGYIHEFEINGCRGAGNSVDRGIPW